MKYEQFSCPSHTPLLSAEFAVIPTVGMGKLLQAQNPIPLPWLHQHSYWKGWSIFPPTANGSLVGSVITLRPHLSPMLITSKKKCATKTRTLPLNVAWNTKIKYMIFFFPLSISLHLHFLHVSILWHRQNLDWSKCLESTGPPSKALYCSWSLTALTDLQFRMKIISSVTSNEFFWRMPLICTNLKYYAPDSLLNMWHEPAVNLIKEENVRPQKCQSAGH